MISKAIYKDFSKFWLKLYEHLALNLNNSRIRLILLGVIFKSLLWYDATAEKVVMSLDTSPSSCLSVKGKSILSVMASNLAVIS